MKLHVILATKQPRPMHACFSGRKTFSTATVVYDGWMKDDSSSFSPRSLQCVAKQRPAVDCSRKDCYSLEKKLSKTIRNTTHPHKSKVWY